MHRRRPALAVLPLLLAARFDGCSEHEIGCPDAVPVEESMCGSLAGELASPPIVAAAEAGTAPAIGWASRVRLPAGGTGWVRTDLWYREGSWAVLADPAVPLSIHLAPDGPAEPPDRTVELDCGAAGAFDRPEHELVWIRIGPTVEPEVRLARWEDALCE